MEKNKKIIVIAIVAIMIIIIVRVILLKEEKQEARDYLSVYEINDTMSEEEKEVIQTIKIHISGEVQYNGILELEEGSRVDDAIKLAGGITENADINQINLAYELSDGQKLYIPKIDDESHFEPLGTYSESKVNINKAIQTELETLPGIGPSLALKIIKYREENGKFKSIEDIKNVKGLGESKYEEIKDLIQAK